MLRIEMSSDLEALCKEHEEAMLRFAWLRAGNLADAQDIVQNALIQAVAALREGFEPKHARAWMIQITYRELCAFKRRAASLKRKLMRLFLHSPEPRDLARSDVREALAEIPDPYGPILILRFIQEFTVPEIAEALDMPASTVKVYVWRGVGLLREKLRDSR